MKSRSTPKITFGLMFGPPPPKSLPDIGAMRTLCPSCNDYSIINTMAKENGKFTGGFVCSNCGENINGGIIENHPVWGRARFGNARFPDEEE